MVDLTALFAKAQGLVDEALASSGTRVKVSAAPNSHLRVDVDPDSLAADDDTAEDGVRYASLAGLVIVGGAGGGDQLPATVVLAPGDARVILPASASQVQPGDVVDVLACRDPRMLSTSWAVFHWDDSSAGAARIGYAHPYVRGTGT